MDNPQNLLVFDINSDYAQFKKFFTNMSPLTFAIPPRTVIAGIIGAIIGQDKKNNPEIFSKDRSFISVKINSPIKKFKLPTNYIKTTSLKHVSKFKEHKPTNVEYLKDPCFRIYFSHQDNGIYQKLKNGLENHTTIYTINLGISACIANFHFVGEYNLKTHGESETFISSVIPKEKVGKINFEDSIMVQESTLPNIMLNDREVTEYRNFIYEVNGKDIKAYINNYYHIQSLGENIVEM